MNNNLTTKENFALKAIINNPKLRAVAAYHSFPLFIAIYFPELEYPCADFHRQFMALAEDTSRKFYVVQASRGFGKSTYLNLYYTLWATLGVQQKKFIVIISGTMDQATRYMADVKYQLEHNQHHLVEDMGPFHIDGQWSVPAMDLDNLGAKIIAASQGTPIRGFLHNGKRPDLVILDDLESRDSTRTIEGRDETYRWFVNDVVPGGTEEKTKFVILCTHLHDDSFVSRIMKGIETGRRSGYVRRFPFLDFEGNALWKERYPDQDAVDAYKRFIGDEAAFDRECMLRTPTDEGQIFLPEWIREFSIDQHPGFGYATDFRKTLISIDASGTDKESSDYHAIVVADVWRYQTDMRIYIMEARHFHSSLHDLQVNIEETYRNHRVRTGYEPLVLIEAGGLQGWLAEGLERNHIPVEKRSTKKMGKDERLRISTGPSQRGQVWFLREGPGIELAKQEILGYESERYHDVMDSFTQLILYAIENSMPTVSFPGCTPLNYQQFPAERINPNAQHAPGNTDIPPVDFHKKKYWELTANEKRLREEEEDLRLMKESMERRRMGLEG